MTIADELHTGHTIIRELTTEDAADLTSVGQNISYVWGNILPVPVSAADASDLITHWESVRAAGRRNLAGVFTLDGRLVGAIAVITDEFTAQAAAWGSADESDRRLVVEGVAFFIRFLRDSCAVMRLWVDVPPRDRHTSTSSPTWGCGRRARSPVRTERRASASLSCDFRAARFFSVSSGPAAAPRRLRASPPAAR